jgi:4-amino-4-deoxy-L-arabinose transferase-like glycosyltransferase
MSTRSTWLRDGGLALVAIATAVLLLRLPGLAWLPATFGDEDFWAAYAAQAARGQIVHLDPVHRGNSPAPAYILGAAMRVIGPSFFSMRLCGVLAVLVGAIVSYLLFARIGARRMGLTVAGVLALHPWSVIYSRVASVPYAMALSAMTVAATLFWIGLRRRSSHLVAAGVVLVALSAHLSPLTFVVVPPCLAVALEREHRWVFRRPLPLLAGGLAILLVVPLVIWARQTAVEPPNAPASLLDGILLAAYMILVTIPGENSVRHFTDRPMGPVAAVVLAALVVLALIAYLASRQIRRTRPEARFALWMLASGALLLPLLLAPARMWHMPENNADRYVFVLLPGLAFCLGVVAESSSRWWRLLPAAFAGVLLVGSLRMLYPLAYGHGVHRGWSTLRGGCYYGWMTTQDHQPPSVVIARTAQQLSATTVLYWGYPLRTLNFLLRDSPIVPAFYEEPHRWQGRSGKFLFVFWSEAAYPPAAGHNPNFRALLTSPEFSGAKLERRVLQPDGFPLLELWSAQRSAPAGL